jgi:hypothetical protein
MQNEIKYDRRYDGNHDEAAERAFDADERFYRDEQREERAGGLFARRDDDAIEGRQSDYPTTCRVAAPFDAILTAFLKGAR